MTDDRAQLILDESLFLAAIEIFFELENEEEKFEILLAVEPFAASDRVAERFEADLGREIGAAERRDISHYVNAVVRVSHHNYELSHIQEMERDHDGPVMDFIRLAAWAFLSAWTHTYGGLRAHLLVEGSSTLVDPQR